ncbi:MAG TPA: hypothetical protein VFG42_01595 [Baekduia sp.]|uniref:hypothetical protein n=1 Tax=Baekduia sp. TaxID=2600305 RepID=UPI002D79B950|nr:hypothetical protein [Baekduia sp.]HET6505457.1 hypothetical protein [Baekduia sp.]
MAEVLPARWQRVVVGAATRAWSQVRSTAPAETPVANAVAVMVYEQCQNELTPTRLHGLNERVPVTTAPVDSIAALPSAVAPEQVTVSLPSDSETGPPVAWKKCRLSSST